MKLFQVIQRQAVDHHGLLLSILLSWILWVSPQTSQAQSFLETVQEQQDSIQAEQNAGLLFEDSISIADTNALSEEEKTPQYIEREYNHKEQVITGGVVMLCIGLILVTSNNFNPKH